jgi:protein-tyrosine phosphatase
MAEAFLQKRLPHVKVSSAGLAALVGDGADPGAISAMAQLKMDISSHQARQVDAAMLAEAHLVFVMSLAQKSALEKKYPWVRGRVFRLGEWDRFDIDDPVGLSPEAYVRARCLIEQGCDSWTAKLRTYE